MLNDNKIWLDGHISLGLDLDDYQAVVIWCEAFQQFITVAKLEN